MQSFDEFYESLWANIHKKRQRIKKGSGEKMRKVGDKGAPTRAQMSRAKGEGVNFDRAKEKHDNELENLKEQFLETNEPPLCSVCGGIIKTATISFGQAMPEREMRISQKKAIESDLFICIGTSLAVFPAADLPLLAKETGSTLVILNNEPTQMDQYADLVINRDISEVFSEISI